MKSYLAVMLAVTALFSLAFSSPAPGDTLQVGDYFQPGEVSLIKEGDELLAPCLLGLQHQGYSFVSKGHSLLLITPAGKEISLLMGAKQAAIGKETVTLKAAPRYLSQRAFLPVNSLAGPLGLEVSWQEKTRQLRLRPKLTLFKVEDKGDTIKLLLGGQVPLAYDVNNLVDPARAVIDISNLVLSEGTLHLEVASSVLLGVRAAAQSTEAPGLRIVLDLSQPAPSTVTASDHGCTLEVSLPKKPQALAPPKAILKSIEFTRNSPKLATITLNLSAPVTADSELRKAENTLVVRLFGAARQVENPPKIKDPLVSSIALRSLGPAGEVQEIVVKLKKEARYLLNAEGTKVRVLLGDFSLADIKIVIDPGHGGCMSGATGRSGLMEKDVNLDIAKKLEALLQQAGANPTLTRSDDCELRPIAVVNGKSLLEDRRSEVKTRAELANQLGADLLVSIHCNANPKGNRSGTEVYYYSPRSQGLARSLQEELLKTLGRADGGIHVRDFWVLATANMPAVLVEVAYIDNPEEEKLLATEDFRALAAKGILLGLSRFVANGGLVAALQTTTASGTTP
jgi:N-acetylmuramoyl-L-alanine amidase